LALKSEQLIDPDLDGKARSLQPVQESTHKEKISQHCSPKYRWALMVGCLLAFFQQLTGINVVILYSNKVFTSGSNEENHNDLIRARTGTVIVGVVNWAATMVAIPLLFKIGRKALMLVGHTGMSLALIALGVLAIFEIDIAIIAFTMVFIAFFEIGVGSVVFLYLAEIMTEFGISMALAVVWSLTILVSLVTPRMIEQLHQDGLYFMFAGINVIGWFFILFCIKETKGKSKIELKGLYSKQNNNLEDVEVNISDEVTA